MNAVAEMGWSALAKVQTGYAGRSEQGPDLSIKLPSREILVAIREPDERGRPGHAFITQTDYLTRTERTTVNKELHGVRQAGGDADTGTGEAPGPQPTGYRQIHPRGPTARPHPGAQDRRGRLGTERRSLSLIHI